MVAKVFQVVYGKLNVQCNRVFWLVARVLLISFEWSLACCNAGTRKLQLVAKVLLKFF